MTRQVVLLGWPVGHSLSPLMQEAAFDALGLDWRYTAVAVRPEHLERVLADLEASPTVVGANVTLPHKTGVLRHVPSSLPAACAAGAANTLVRNGGFEAHNTDIEGFLGCLDEAGFSPAGARCVILGAGGAARACAVALAGAGAAEVTLVGRSAARARDLVDSLLRTLAIPPAWPSLRPLCWADIDGLLSAGTPPVRLAGNAATLMIINATPAGTWPDVSESPLSSAQVDILPPGTQIVDLVYRPRTTKLMKLAAARGLPTVGGQEMLVRQGAASLSLWLGEPLEARVIKAMRDALTRALTREEKASCCGC